MNKETYEQAKSMFLSGKSLRKIAEELNINRKLLSKKLKDEGIYTNKFITDSQFQIALDLFNQDKSLTYIAQQINVDRHTLSKEFDRRGYDKSKSKYSKNYMTRKITQYDEIILERYSNKQSIQLIADELSISTNTVWNCLLKYNAVDSNRTSRIYDIDESKFESISTEEEAYWLGFFMADGYVDEVKGELSLCLQYSDKEHVDKFIQFLGSNKTGYYKDNNGYDAYRADIGSRKLTNNLKKLSCCQAKTYTLKFPSYQKVPKRLMKHFIRGYFDADGCACISKKSLSFSIVSANKQFIYRLQDFLIKELKINKTKINESFNSNTNNILYCIRNSAYEDLKRIYNYLYSDATIFLERKHQKFITYFNLKSNAVLGQKEENEKS